MIKTFLFLLSSVMLVFQAYATTLVYKSFEDIVNEADGILIGRVTNVEARMDEQAGIYTYVTLGEVEMVYGRYDAKELTLRMEGGQVGGYGLEVEGSPNFRQNEKVVVFVAGNGQRIVPFVGWGQGVFRVMVDPESREEIVTDSDGNRLYAVQSGQLIKEYRVPSETEFVGAPAPVYPYSRPAQGGLGQASEGDVGESLEQRIEDRTPMNIEEFIGEVQRQARQRQVAPAPLVSVTFGERLEPREGRDARPRPVEEPGEIRTTPPSEMSPGESPSRIDTEAERRRAEEAEERQDRN